MTSYIFHQIAKLKVRLNVQPVQPYNIFRSEDI